MVLRNQVYFDQEMLAVDLDLEAACRQGMQRCGTGQNLKLTCL